MSQYMKQLYFSSFFSTYTSSYTLKQQSWVLYFRKKKYCQNKRVFGICNVLVYLGKLPKVSIFKPLHGH